MPNKYINKLEGQRVLIFGGTSGIGHGVVEASLEHGAIVFITGSNMPKLEKTRGRLMSQYPDLAKDRIHLYACNLADADNQEDNIKALLNTVTNGGKSKLNHIVHTAGDALGLMPLSNFSTHDWLKVSTVRLLTAMFIAKHAREHVESSADSCITFTSGVNSTKPGKNWAVQCANGGAIEAFTRGAAVELAPIRVNCIAPGAIKTELFAGIPPDVEEVYKNANLVKRLGRPSDTAETYIYCMKDGFVNGEIIATNGGYLLV